MGAHDHREKSPRSVKVFVLTVSDTRVVETDSSGQLIRRKLEEGGHEVLGHEIVKDDRDAIAAVLRREIAKEEAQATIITGGTGISKRDVTVEVVRALLNKELPGFGELFRMLSYEEIGAAAMLSRATAGMAERMVLLACPGSRGAVNLAMDKLILPELGHLVREATR